jgi:hypothetical protein
VRHSAIIKKATIPGGFFTWESFDASKVKIILGPTSDY